MFEIARYLEQMAVQFKPVVLVGPGLAVVLLGLFVWLGGLGFRRALFVILGAVSGGVLGFFITAQNAWLTIILAVIAAFIAVMFEKVFTIILAAVLAAVLCFAILARPYTESGEKEIAVRRDKTQDRVELSIQQSTKIMEKSVADFVSEIKEIVFYMPVRNWIIMAVLMVVFIAAGFFLWRLASAFCCAALGAMLVFAGMILLLLYKGAAPISRILQNQPFYIGVFAAMTAFGMTEQLLLCPGIKRKSERKKKKDNVERESEGWRSK